jgi:hypothetical protein
MALDPDGEPAKVSQEEIEKAHFKNPSSRWWCIIGFALALIGMGLLMIGGAVIGDPVSIVAIGGLMYMAFRLYRASTT